METKKKKSMQEVPIGRMGSLAFGPSLSVWSSKWSFPCSFPANQTLSLSLSLNSGRKSPRLWFMEFSFWGRTKLPPIVSFLCFSCESHIWVLFNFFFRMLDNQFLKRFCVFLCCISEFWSWGSAGSGFLSLIMPNPDLDKQDQR